MAWVETASLSFAARHDSDIAEEAAAMLADLEEFRAELEDLFDVVPAGVAVVVHPRPLMMNFAVPWLPLARAVSAPAGRRYFAGFFAAREIHVLAPAALEKRASAVPGSREALMRAPRHEYAHVVVGANNLTLPPPFSPATFRRYARSAWLCEGAAAYLAGQVPLMRAAVARRLREGGRPQFPPASRDALVLGGTVFEMLHSEHGPEACAELARAPDTRSPRRAIEEAFGRPAANVEREWADYLAALTAG